MSTQLKPLPDNPEWKDKYYQARKEFGEKEKNWLEEEGGLYKSILRLVLSYTGLDEELDQQLSRMRDKLRQETSSEARHEIINPLIEEVVNFARNRDSEDSQAITSGESLGSLFEKLDLSAKYQQQVEAIKKSLLEDSDANNIQICLDQLSKMLNQVCHRENTEADRIQLRFQLVDATLYS